MSEENKEKKLVPWVIFVWAMGIVFLSIAALTKAQASLSSKVDGYINSSNELRVDLGEIKTDLKWIKQALNINH